jgi:hypothetical protein
MRLTVPDAPHRSQDLMLDDLGTQDPECWVLLVSFSFPSVVGFQLPSPSDVLWRRQWWWRLCCSWVGASMMSRMSRISDEPRQPPSAQNTLNARLDWMSKSRSQLYRLWFVCLDLLSGSPAWSVWLMLPFSFHADLIIQTTPSHPKHCRHTQAG